MLVKDFAPIKGEFHDKWLERCETLAQEAYKVGLERRKIEDAQRICQQMMKLADICVFIKRQCAHDTVWMAFHRVTGVVDTIEKLRRDFLADKDLSLQEQRLLFAEFFSMVAGYLAWYEAQL